MLERVVSELADTATPVHTWEQSLDLLILEGEKLGESGTPAIQSAGRLRDLMRDYMGDYSPVSLEKKHEAQLQEGVYTLIMHQG